MSQSHNADPAIYADREAALERASGLPFRYIGHYAPVKVFALVVHSELLGRQLVRRLNGVMAEGASPARLGNAEPFHTGDKVRISFTRWHVTIPVESVTEEFLKKLETHAGILAELTPHINTLREKFFDAVTGVATAGTALREFENAVSVEVMLAAREREKELA